MIRRSPLKCRNRTARNSSTIGKSSHCKAVPPVTDEQNHSSSLPGTGNRTEILAQPGSTGRHTRVSPLGGAGVSIGRQRTERPGYAPAFRENHVRLVPPCGRWLERLPPPGGENSPV